VSIQRRPDGKWRARYRGADGKEHARHFDLKRDAQAWLDAETAKLVTGMWTTPKNAKITMGAWCDTWIAGYQGRASTVSQARVTVKVIKKYFDTKRVSAIAPSDVKTWTKQLTEDGYAKSTIAALHSRLGQVLADAVQDGIIPRSPVSRRTSPGHGEQIAYVATTAQIWALHDALPENLRGIVLLGAFAGLRRNEIIALRVEDVDFMRGIITPAIQFGGLPLKTAASKNPIPIPNEMALELGLMPAKFGCTTIVCNAIGRPVTPTVANKAFTAACKTVEGLPEGFRMHDLRHYFASLLIAAGLDVKTVQQRHAAHLGEDHPGRVRAPVAGPGRVLESGRRGGVRGPFDGFGGLIADCGLISRGIPGVVSVEQELRGVA
jgi:integrase